MILATQILNNLKEGDEIYLSELIYIFNITFGTKIIIKFLETYPKLDILFDVFIENKDFKKKILTLYENDINYFLKKILIFFKRKKLKVIKIVKIKMKILL